MSFGGQSMATTWSVRLVADSRLEIDRLRRDCQAALDRIVAQMSQWEPESHLSRFNRADAGEWLALPPEFAAVMAEALELARMTGGAFDPTVGAASEAWGFGASQVRLAPTGDALKMLATGQGWARLDFEPGPARLRQPGGIALDLCAIAKGYGVDRLAEVITAAGVSSYIVEVGGELRAQGLKPDFQPWWVDLEVTDSSEHAPLRIALSGFSVATSGHARRFHDVDGMRLGHTIDPASGAPLRNGTQSVTVLAETAMRADALATALMVMGDAAADFACHYGIAARIVADSEILTPVLAAMLD